MFVLLSTLVREQFPGNGLAGWLFREWDQQPFDAIQLSQPGRFALLQFLFLAA
jgi:hypothetical protein